MSHRIGGVTDAAAARPARDPRALRSRQAIIEAVTALLREEGPGAITHQRVAERAGVGRATVYRHWPRPHDLLAEAMDTTDIPLIETTEGPLRDQLRTDLKRLADDLREPIVASVVSTLLQRAQWDDAARQRRHELSNRVVTKVRDALDAAVATGELRASPEPDEFAAQLLGPFLYRNLVQDKATDTDLIDRVVDGALAPWIAQHLPGS